MAEGRERAQWEHTSSVRATLINAHGGWQGGRAAHPAELNPFGERVQRGETITADRIGVLINAFVPPERRRARRKSKRTEA